MMMETSCGKLPEQQEEEGKKAPVGQKKKENNVLNETKKGSGNDIS